jgi:hypothetical protein
VLADLGKTASDFRQLSTRALDQLCGALMPRLRPALDEAVGASYELADGDLAGGSPPASLWPQALLLALGAHVAWLRPLLTPGGYDALVHLALDKVGAERGRPRLELSWAQLQSALRRRCNCSACLCFLFAAWPR